MRAATVVAHAAVLSSVGAGLAAKLLPLRNRTGAFWMCALILDCFGHRISPVRYFVLPFFDAKVLKKVKPSGA
jgi:hypothetical protein